jgi:hypothetical protein
MLRTHTHIVQNLGYTDSGLSSPKSSRLQPSVSFLLHTLPQYYPRSSPSHPNSTSPSTSPLLPSFLYHHPPSRPPSSTSTLIFGLPSRSCLPSPNTPSAALVPSNPAGIPTYTATCNNTSLISSSLHLLRTAPHTCMVSNQIWRECFNLAFAGPGSNAAPLASILYELGIASGRE